MKLIIAEKPELGRAIAQALNLNGQEHNGVIAGKDYTVIWAYGHLMGLKQPEQYDEKYAAWNLQDLPIYFEHWQLVPSKGKEKRLQQIESLIAGADEIIHAGIPTMKGNSSLMKFWNTAATRIRFTASLSMTTPLGNSEKLPGPETKCWIYIHWKRRLCAGGQ